MNSDLITLAAVLGTIVLGLSALAVAHRAIDRADRARTALVQAMHRAARAETDAARWKTMAGISVVDPRRPDPMLDAVSTLTMPRVNERHPEPLSRGGAVVQFRRGVSDVT